MSSRPAAVAFLVDVDNTLLDNDRVTADLKRHLETQVGPERWILRGWNTTSPSDRITVGPHPRKRSSTSREPG